MGVIDGSPKFQHQAAVKDRFVSTLKSLILSVAKLGCELHSHPLNLVLCRTRRYKQDDGIEKRVHKCTRTLVTLSRSHFSGRMSPDRYSSDSQVKFDITNICRGD
mgnify:CR=1 FL=1